MSPRLEREAEMDEMSSWAVKHQQARFQPIGSAIPDPLPPMRFVPDHILSRNARSFVSNADVSNALDWMFDHGELSEELSERIDDVAEEFAQKRIACGEVAKPTAAKYVGLAVDAVDALRQIITTIRGQDNFDQFSEVDVDKWAAICARAGYSLEVSHG